MSDLRTSSQPLRIAVVAACAFPSARGSQVLIRDLAHALAARGHDVHVVTYPFGEHLVPIRGMNVHLHRGRATGWATTARLPWFIRKLLLDIQLLRSLYRVVRRHAIDVIHAHNYEGPLVSYVVRLLTGVPVVYHSHNALGDELAWYVTGRWRRSIARRLGAFLDGQVPRRADFAIALTPQLAGCLRANGVTGERLAILPPGAPVCLSDDNVGGGHDSFNGRFVVMYAGNLDGYQDLPILAQGFRVFREQVPEALLVLVTHEAQWRHRLASELLHLHQIGALQVIVAPSFSVVRRLLRQADVLACPRSSWSGYPIKLLNYLAAGRPLVVAEGSAKCLTDGTDALVFRNRDSADLAAALWKLWSDPALRTRLADAARSMAVTLPTWREAVDRIEEIYAAVCGGRSRAVGTQASKLSSQGLIAISRDRISAASGDRVG
jgi:glycosyltransferase involved in cell wall biosynthesis